MTESEELKVLHKFVAELLRVVRTSMLRDELARREGEPEKKKGFKRVYVKGMH